MESKHRMRRHTAVVQQVGLLFVLMVGMLIRQTPVASLDSHREWQTSISEPLSLITPQMVQPIVIKLSGDEYEGRGAGYAGEKKAAEFIADEFKRIGLKPAGDLILQVARTTFRRDMTLQTLQKMQMETATGQRGMQLPATVLRCGKQLEMVIDLRHPSR